MSLRFNLADDPCRRTDDYRSGRYVGEYRRACRHNCARSNGDAGTDNRTRTHPGIRAKLYRSEQIAVARVTENDHSRREFAPGLDALSAPDIPYRDNTRDRCSCLVR